MSNAQPTEYSESGDSLSDEIARLDLDADRDTVSRERWVGDEAITSPKFHISVDATDLSDEQRHELKMLSARNTVDPQVLCDLFES